MTRRHRQDDGTDTTLRREGVHVVHGAVIRCCEQDEALCPCTCHEPSLKLRPHDPPPEAA